MSARLATLILILTSVSLNAGAQILLRGAARSGFAVAGRGPLEVLMEALSRPGILGGIACYGLSLLTWIAVLSRAEASLAYPFLGLGFVMVAIMGHFLLGEVITPTRMLAIAIIVCGVGLLATS